MEEPPASPVANEATTSEGPASTPATSLVATPLTTPTASKAPVSISAPAPATTTVAVTPPDASPEAKPTSTPSPPSNTSSSPAKQSEPSMWFRDVLSRLKQQKQTSPPSTKEDGPSQEPKEPEAPGMSSTTKELYEGPERCQDCFTWVDIPPPDAKEDEPAEKEQGIHALLLKYKKSPPELGPPYTLRSIAVQSPLLRCALGSVLAGYPGMTAGLEDMVFEAPFKSLFYRLGELKTALEDMESKASAEGTEEHVGDDAQEAVARPEDPEEKTRKKTAEHLRLLYDVISKEMSGVAKVKADLTSKGVVTFDHLWTLFAPGTLVYTRRHGPLSEEQAFKVTGEVSLDEKQNLCVPCSYVEYDGEKFGWTRTVLLVAPFAGTKAVADLSVFPVSFHPRREELEQRLGERGQKWESLAGVQHRTYEGLARCPDEQRATLGSSSLPALNVSGRIMVDAKGYREAIWWESNEDLEPLDGDAADAPESSSLTASEHLLCPAVVRGYSLALKQWAVFNVGLVNEIEWSSDAFDRLVLPETTKQALLALVDIQLGGDVQFNDFVDGKGQGIAFLLHGPSGIGKTLTAESVAEHFKAPLYRLGAADIGRDASGAERQFQEVSHATARWKAVLLIEDADVFITQGAMYEPMRNHTRSVLLRILEYYPGILFLTASRVDVLDPALESRIDITLDYAELSAEARKSTWDAFISGSPVPVELSDAEREELAGIEMSGRQIRNVFKVAAMLAAKESSPVAMSHCQKAQDVVCAKKTREEAHPESEGRRSLLLADGASQRSIKSPVAPETNGTAEGSSEADKAGEQGEQAEQQQQQQQQQNGERTGESASRPQEMKEQVARPDTPGKRSEDSDLKAEDGRTKLNWKARVRWSRMKTVT